MAETHVIRDPHTEGLFGQLIQLAFGDVQLPAEIRHVQRLGEVLFRIFPQDEGKIPAAAADALIVNRDPDWIFGALKGETKEEMQASIEQYFSMFGGYGITDLALCVYSQSANVPSGYVSFMGDRLNTLSEYSETDPYRPIVRNLNRCWYEFGLDPVKTCIDMMRGFGIRPWLTMRMNDATMGGWKKV